MDLEHLLNEEITIKRLDSRNDSGDGVRGTTLAAWARIERAHGAVPGTGGEALDSAARLFTLTEVLLSDLIYFPEDTAQNDAHRVTRVDAYRDLAGDVAHYEVTL